MKLFNEIKKNKIKEKLKDPKNKIPQDLLKKLGRVLK